MMIRVVTGDRKAPDGSYVIVVELPGRDPGRVLGALEGLDVDVDVAGTTLFIKTRSRRVRDLAFRRLRALRGDP